MSNSDIEEAVISPMVASFPAPAHVRGNTAAIESLLNVYRRALERFDKDTLEQAWQKVAAAQEYWMWPKPADLVEACESIQGRPVPVEDDWVERATALMDNYVKRYMLTTQAAVRARAGGYEEELRDYVRECAWVQSQFIAGRKGVGYFHSVLFPAEDRDKDAEYAFFKKAEEQAKSGHIRVTAPPDLIAAWKEEAAAKGQIR